VSTETQTPPLALRPVAPADEPFLAALYASTRAEEMALVDWGEGQKQAFLWQQFQAQQVHYQAFFPEGAHQVVECDGEPVGRIYLDRSEGRLHLLDIALLPQWRGQGLGGALMAALLHEASVADLPVTLYVYRFDTRVRAWYQRLGFVLVSESGLYDMMEWRPARPGAE
jgi:ribosomal protein S18 acetylase RimI-like enzyme